jgi:TPR repeat protein
MKRSRRLAQYVIAGAAALVALSASCGAYAQSADLVLCDRLAADPADPDKPADVKGVATVAAGDVATAIKFCKQASNSRRAMYQLGRAYAANRQTNEAIGAWRKAADKGSTSAMVELGVAYATGAGVNKDEAAAAKLFERAAQGGNPRGVRNLAALSGKGAAPADAARSRVLLAKAAETNAEAQFQLGLMLQDGVGGPKDDAARATCSRKRRRRIIPVRLSAWAHSRRQGEVVRRIRAQRKPITRRLRRSATTRPRRRSSVRNVLTC